MMVEFKIKNGKIYNKLNFCKKIDVFEITEKIPSGFFVWNIGENMGSDEYIPICEKLHPEDKNDFSINTNTLKAIKLTKKEVEALREAAIYNIVSKAAAEKALRSKRTSRNANKLKELAAATIEIFNRITE